MSNGSRIVEAHYNGDPENDISESEKIVNEFKEKWNKHFFPKYQIIRTNGFCHWDGLMGSQKYKWEHKDDPASREYGNAYFELAKCRGNKYGRLEILDKSCVSVLASLGEKFLWTQRYWVDNQVRNRTFHSNVLMPLLDIRYNGKLEIGGFQWERFIKLASKNEFRNNGLRFRLGIGPPDRWTAKMSVGLLVPISQLPRGIEI